MKYRDTRLFLFYGSHFLLLTSHLLFFCITVHAGSRLHVPRAVGKDFYIVFPKAAWGNQNVGVLINSPTAQTATITPPKGKPTAVVFDKPRTTKYVGNLFNIESIPEVVRSREATRIRTDDAVSIVGQFGIAGISGTYTAMPITSWGNEYYVVAPPEGTNQDYYYYPTIYSVPMVTIIGSHLSTTVTITPTALTARGHEPTVPYTITLNDGDVFNITTAGDPKATTRTENSCKADLSGSHITSDFPVGVIVSQSHSSWPCGYNECGDYCVEWLPPVANWDSLYVITPSLTRYNDQDGEALRLVFMHDSTVVTVDDGQIAPRIVGMYNAGEWTDYQSPISSAIVLSASHPFLTAEFTRTPGGCQGGGYGFSLCMMITNGVHQWSSYAPYCAPTGSQSIANVCFVLSDSAKLKFNGKPILQQFPIVKHFPQGLAMIPMGINSATYCEITGDSGAGAAGNIFGYGTRRSSPGGDHGNHVQDPEMIKSFAHPIGGSFTPLTSKDTVAPRCTIKSVCGGWSVSATEDVNDVNETGIYDLWLEHLMPSDSSGNVVFHLKPSFAYGAMNVSNTIDIVNLFQSGQAALHVRDGAGNQFDTVLTANPIVLDVTPRDVDLALVRPGDSVNTKFVIRNHGDSAVILKSYRLKSGAHWNIGASAPAAPITLNPNDSLRIVCTYKSPTGTLFEIDRDTLMVTMCKEYAVASMRGSTKLPAILTAQCFDFGAAAVDTFGFGGDTVSSQKNIWITNAGSDTLRVTGLSITGSINPPEANYPATNYWFTNAIHQTQLIAVLPTAQAPWLIPAHDTIFVNISAHPTHSGERRATITYSNSSGHALQDTTCLVIKGIAPGISANDIDYGSHLYATIADSFFMVRNIGQIEFRIERNGFTFGPAADSTSFEFHQYVDTATGGYIVYDINDTTHFWPDDSAQVPFRFIANAVGDRTANLTIRNSTSLRPVVALHGRTVQPHIDGLSACIPDSVHVGDTVNTTLMIRNAGDAILYIEGMDIGGWHAADWTITRVWVPASGFTITAPPWGFIPLRGSEAVAGSERAYVSLQWIPTVHGPGDSVGVTLFNVIGKDTLGRHAMDSTGITEYPWQKFPYDTAMPIWNLPCLSGVDQHAITTPSQNILWPNYPNPFSTTTALSYTIGAAGHVTLRIVNMLGEMVVMLVNAHQPAGTYSVTAKGAGLKAGMYFVELNSGGVRVARKIIFME